MSSPVVNNIVLANEELLLDVVDTKVKAPRVKKPALPAKLQKFASFQFSLITYFRDNGLFSDEDFERALVDLHVLDYLDAQIVYFTNTLATMTEKNKILRKFVTERNAPPKLPKKERAPRAPKEPKDPNAPKKERAPRAPKDPDAPKKSRAKKNLIVSNDTEDNLVAQLVAAAYSQSDPSSHEPTSVPTVELAVKVKKPTKKNTPIVVDIQLPDTTLSNESNTPSTKLTKTPKEPKAPKEPKPPKEPKTTKQPKAPKEPKESKKMAVKLSDSTPLTNATLDSSSTQPHVPDNSHNTDDHHDDEDEDEDEDIQTREIFIDGVLFLLDDADNALYSPDSSIDNPLLGHLRNDSFVPL
jgi:hypothetical protein